MNTQMIYGSSADLCTSEFGQQSSCSFLQLCLCKWLQQASHSHSVLLAAFCLFHLHLNVSRIVVSWCLTLHYLYTPEQFDPPPGEMDLVIRSSCAAFLSDSAPYILLFLNKEKRRSDAKGLLYCLFDMETLLLP